MVDYTSLSYSTLNVGKIVLFTKISSNSIPGGDGGLHQPEVPPDLLHHQSDHQHSCSW